MLSALVVLLLALAGVGLRRELRTTPAADAAGATPMTERGVEHVPLSPADEAYAASLWTVHSQVKQDAVRMTFAGLSYQMKDIQAADLRERTAPLVQSFQHAQDRLSQLAPPPSLQPLHDRYLAALKRYEEAAKLMTQFARDADNKHLIKAQALSQSASEDLLRVGDVLWPGEHKPN